MAGNSNSGRLPAYEEFNKSHVINKLWEKVRIKVDKGEELSEYEEKLVLSLLPKTIKTETDMTTAGKPLPILSINKDAIQSDNSNESDTGTNQED